MAAAVQKRILVVDDDRDTREALSILLEEMGYEVALANSGQSALAYLNEFGDIVKLILLDLNMPVMNGWEFLQSFHLNSQLLSEIPVLILSGLDVPLPEHAAAMLRKPVNADMLARNIARFIKGATSSPA